MITKQFLLGLTCTVMGYCGNGPAWANLLVGLLGVYLLWTEKDHTKEGQ